MNLAGVLHEKYVRHGYQFSAVAANPFWGSLEVAWWCSSQFRDEKALFHFLRIERRAGRVQMKLAGKFELSNWETQIRHHGEEWCGRELIRFAKEVFG